MSGRFFFPGKAWLNEWGGVAQDEEILKRNYNVKLESTVDVSLLPKVMQVRNFGKVRWKVL